MGFIITSPTKQMQTCKIQHKVSKYMREPTDKVKSLTKSDQQGQSLGYTGYLATFEVFAILKYEKLFYKNTYN